MKSGKRRCIARIAATTHSDTGPSWTPTALQTMTPGGTMGSNQSTPALSDCTTRSLGSSSNRPGSRSAMSKLSTTSSTSDPGSATSWTPSGKGSSSRLIGPSGTSTCNRLSGSANGGRALFERELEDFLDPAGQMKGHLIAHALGYVIEGLLVPPREDEDRKSTRLNSSHEWISY